MNVERLKPGRAIGDPLMGGRRDTGASGKFCALATFLVVKEIEMGTREKVLADLWRGEKITTKSPRWLWARCHVRNVRLNHTYGLP